MPTMLKRRYTLHLATPAFLGGALQSAEWRTPPLKSLLREWWRITVAPEVGYAVAGLKQRETRLFGTAADESAGENRQSSIRLALAHWHDGKLTDWSEVNPASKGRPGEDPRIRHPEVQFGNGMVGSQLYLGYGPLVLDKPAPKLKSGAALQAGETNTLSLAFPEIDGANLTRALTLIHWFGTVGGRSRNGWGSLLLQAGADSPALPALSRANLEAIGCIRTLDACLKLDWPHAIGRDTQGPLVWCSKDTFADWRAAMRFLAQLKIDFRTALKFNSGKNAMAPEKRHALAYPVTNHSVRDWDNGRIANTLRFKLHTETDGTLRACIYHTPCHPTLRHQGIDLPDTWQQVHRHLDANSALIRLP